MAKTGDGIAILKVLWRKEPDGRWAMHDLRSIGLSPRQGDDPTCFQFESKMELLTNRPVGTIHDVLSTFGPTAFLMQQSIVPVVAWVRDELFIRCVGTAFVISCSGYVITACHVLLDPQERGYGKVVRRDNVLEFGAELQMGVLVPLSPASGINAVRFLPFEQCWYWGEWKVPPLIHERERFEILTDIAICKVPEMPGRAAHQPLNISTRSFAMNEVAYALGYAEMDDIPIEVVHGRPVIKKMANHLHVSIGEVAGVYADNHIKSHVPTPGPCFDFRARVKGKMSGGPIFGADGAVVRGVVSRSFSGESHAYGAMLGPAVHLPLMGGTTLLAMMKSGKEGIAEMHGAGISGI